MRLGYTRLGLLFATFLSVFHNTDAAKVVTFQGDADTQADWMLPTDSFTVECTSGDSECIGGVGVLLGTDGTSNLVCDSVSGVDDTFRTYTCTLAFSECGEVSFPDVDYTLNFKVACANVALATVAIANGDNLAALTYTTTDFKCTWSDITVTPKVNGVDAPVTAGVIALPTLPVGTYDLVFPTFECVDGDTKDRQYVGLKITFDTGFYLKFKVMKDGFVVFDSETGDVDDFYLTNEEYSIKIHSEDYTVLDGVPGFTSELGGVVFSETFTPAADKVINFAAGDVTSEGYKNYKFAVTLKFGHPVTVPATLLPTVTAVDTLIACDGADIKDAFEATILGAWYDFSHDGANLQMVSKPDLSDPDNPGVVSAPAGSYDISIPGGIFTCGGVANAPVQTTVSIGFEFVATAYHNGEVVAANQLPQDEDVFVRLVYSPPDASYLPALLHALDDLPSDSDKFVGPSVLAYNAFVEGNSVVAEFKVEADASFNFDLPAGEICASPSLCNAGQLIAFTPAPYTPPICTPDADAPVINGAEYLCEVDEHITNKKQVELVFDVDSCTPADEEVLNDFVRDVTLNGKSVVDAIVFIGDGACAATEATLQLDISGLPDGVYTFSLGSSDTSTKTATLRIDRTPPVVTDMTYSGPVVLAGQGFPAGQKIPAAMFHDKFTSVDKLKISFTDSSLTGIALHSFNPDGDWHNLADATLVSTFGLVQYPVGTYSFKVKAKDEVGNIAEGTYKIAVVAPARCVLTVSDDRNLQSRETLVSSSSVFTVTADFDVPVVGVKANSIKCTRFGVPCAAVGKLSASSNSRRYTWTFTNGAAAIKDDDVLQFDLSMDGISVASNNYPVITPSPVYVRVDKQAPGLYSKFRSPYYAVKSVPYTLVLPKTIFYDDVSDPAKIKIVSAAKPLQLGLSFVSGYQGVAKISGVVPSTVNGVDKILSYDLIAEDEALNRVSVVDAVSVRVKASLNPVTITNNDKSVLKVPSVKDPVPVFPSFSQTVPGDVAKVRVYLLYSEVPEEVVVCPGASDFGRDPETNIHFCEMPAPNPDIAGITYKHDDTLHVAPGPRTVRVDFIDANEAVVASFSRTLQVAIPNKVPEVTIDSVPCPAGDFVWDESNPGPVSVFCKVSLEDGDDDYFSNAKVSVIVKDSGPCDPARDFLFLPGNYVPEPKVYGVWSASHCTLSLRSLDATNLISNADLVTALESIKYDNLDPVNPTPGFDCSAASDDCKRAFFIIVEDNGSAGANAKSTSVDENPSISVVTLTSVNTPPKIDQRIAYSRGGFLSSLDLSAFTKTIDPVAGFEYDESVTHYKFVVLTDDAATHKMHFNVSNDSDLPGGVFANGAITFFDSYDGRPNATSIDCGAVNLFNDDLTELSETEIDLSPLNPTTAAEHACTFTVETVAIPFFIDVREPGCPFGAVEEDTSNSTLHSRHYPRLNNPNVYPALSKCAFTPVLVRSDAESREVDIYYEGKEVLDNVFKGLQNMQVPIAAQIAGLSSLRNAARGFFSIFIPRYALFSRQSMDFEYNYADVATLKLPNLPAGADSADLAVALKMSPAGTSFSSDVKICIFVGDTDPTFTRVLAVTSQKDVTDESKGYKDYEILPNQSFNIATGELCATTKHFSVFVPIAYPVSTAPEVPKDHLMGGSCPNACSGQGTCRQQGQCVCFAGFEGYDCSMRVCPTAPSWGEDQTVMHSQSECAGRGLCDRSTGQCVCFDGYEGGACERIKCPNQCSNNGKCRLLSELPEVRQAEYNSWENDRIQVCVCDGGWTGADCSQRICPFGDDPETVCAYNQRQVQRVTVQFESLLGTGSLYNDEFALGFTTLDGSTFWTPRISDFFSGNPENVETALKSLPQFAIDDVEVTLEAATATEVQYLVTMSGRTLTGDHNLFLCPANANGSFGCVAPGCRPMFKQLRYASISAAADTLVLPNTVLSVPHPGAVVRTTLEVTGAGTYYFKETYVDADPAPEYNTEETVLPPAGLRGMIQGPFGLLLDLSSLPPAGGQYAYEWTLPTCNVEVVQEADRDLEAAECANRGVCNRETGQCECFTGYAGYNCAQQTVYV